MQKTISMPNVNLSQGEQRSSSLKPVGLGLLIAAAYFVAIPLVFGANGYLLNVFTTMAAVSFISFGVWLTFAIGRINLAQAGFALIGAYVTAILVSRLGISFWICLPLSGAVAALLGGLIGWPVLRLKGVYFAMITLCITEACRLTALSFPALTNGAQGIVDLPLPGELSLFGLTIIPAFEKGARLPFFYLAGTMMLLGLWFMWLLDTSRVGAVFRSLRQNEDLASSLGINVAKYRVVAFMVSCFYAGAGGAFFATLQQNVYPTTFQVLDSVYFMVYCFVGGLEFVVGPLVGAVVMMSSFELLHDFHRYQTVIFSGLMILCILLMPNGILSVIKRRSGKSEEAPNA
ncbi:branched-chain amino acid ABC transporter permease [Aminobacter sp. AP02]|uniref:branched-chain amino acid ABC transporter permease n=1 Tax=Aminobacter sp. AP02 TaxID=2135737 RepID=UPI000D6D4846|nr:branched-chain amino acid ABC transporter permease [Aminobacter sp. AP02]PWK66475.1 amino acid/amide ABC transporter membrane protein 2 (HAAT family) [Aminobacter sp. AP02]